MKRYPNFEPTPFYFLNDTFDKDEIVRQLDVMKERGIKSFFLHVRDGILDQAYGTAVFFENVRFIVESAKARALNVWLYDEDSFPSGNAGGQIVIDNPELQAYSLKVDKIKPEEINGGICRRALGKVKGLFGYQVFRKKGGEEVVKKITNCFGSVRRYWYRRDMDKTYYCDMQNKLFFPHVRAGTSYAETMFEAKVADNAEIYVAYLQPVFTDSHYGWQADCLNKRTTDEFIKRTHEKYAEYVGEYFGSVIPGIFIDEPAAGGVLPFTSQITEYFENKWGYDVTDYYYKLSSEYDGDGKKVRREYIETVTDLFCDNFIKPIADWCKNHGLLLTGHYYGEEDPLSSSLCAQSVYRQSKLMGIPGFDIIGKYLGDLNHPALLLGSKIVVSSATQCGKEKILAECFALNPFNFGFDGLKKMGDWLFACGITYLAPHSLHYGYGSYQRADAGKSFFFQDRLFEEYLEYCAYAGRTCKLLLDYRPKNDTLVVLPNCALTEEVPFPMCNTGVYPSDRAIEIQNRCYNVVKYFTRNQIGWDITDVQHVRSAKIEKGLITVGCNSYNKVIFIKGGDMEKETYDLIKGQGVDVLFYDGDSFVGFPKPCGLLGDNDNVLLCKKYSEKGELYYLYQNDKSFAEILLPITKPAWVYYGREDKLVKLTVENGYVRLGIRGYDSVLVLAGEPPITPTDEVYSFAVEGDRILECEETPQWVYLPPSAEYAINDYDVKVEYNGIKKEFKNHKYSRIRDLIGTQDEIYSNNFVIPYFDTAKRPQKIYPCKATFKAVVPSKKDCEWLLFDGGSVEGECKFLWNGKEINKSQIEKYRVYDAKNYTFKPEWKKGANILEIVFENCGEFDGVSGDIYLFKR